MSYAHEIIESLSEGFVLGRRRVTGDVWHLQCPSCGEMLPLSDPQLRGKAALTHSCGYQHEGYDFGPHLRWGENLYPYEVRF